MTHANGHHPLDYERPPLEEQERRSRQFLQRMQTRRTVRDFSTEAVPYTLIENAIRVAGSAPSGANQQPWVFVVVGDPAVKAQIRQAAEAEERENYERRMSDEWLEVLAPLGTDWRKPHLEDAPYLIVVFWQPYDVSTDPQTGEQTKVKHYYALESVGIATGMLLAALHVSGLATLTHTPSPMGFLREILGRPSHERPLVVIPVGYPAADATVPAITKKPLDEILIRV